MTETVSCPKSCVIPTEAALQRLSRGPSAMMKLLSYISERGTLETRQKKLLTDFYRRWKMELPTIMASEMPDDTLKEIGQAMVWVDGLKARDFHSNLLDRMNKPDGPIKSLMSYVRDPDDVMKRVKAIKIYNGAKSSQEKLEEDIIKAKEHYMNMTRKEQALKEKVDSVDTSGQETPRFKDLLEKWRKMEDDVNVAKGVYENSMAKESKTRSQFIKDMKEYCQESDSYETRRVEVMRYVLRQLLTADKEMLIYRRQFEDYYDRILEKLDNYDVDEDLAKFRDFFSYVHRFPDPQNGGEIDDDDDNVDVDAVRYDTVRVLNQKKENTSSFSRTAQEEQQKVNNFSRHVTLPLPNPPKECYIAELPNAVNDRPADKAPQVKLTTLDTEDSDKSSSPETSPQQSTAEIPKEESTEPDMKVKVYGLKTFTARRPNEISFKAGHKVYMTKPANAQGLAYGYVKKGKLRKKKVYGFFPADLVTTDASKKKKSALKPRNPFKKCKDATSTVEDCYVNFMGGED